MKALVSIFVFILLFSPAILACSIAQAPPPPMSAADRGLYIFVGEVVGHTEVIKSRIDPNTSKIIDRFYGEGRGLRVKPVEIINLPNAPAADYFEFFKFSVAPWCAASMNDLSSLPIGTQVRIIASEATLIPNRSPENRIRLESKIFDRFSVIQKEEDFTTTADSAFDYKTWKSLQAKVQQSKDHLLRTSFDDFMFIEVTKDLLRLEKTKSEKERYEVLERLIYAPNIDYPRIIDPGLNPLWLTQRRYERRMLPDKPQAKPKKLTKTEKVLLKKRDELEKSGYFNYQQVGFFIFER